MAGATDPIDSPTPNLDRITDAVGRAITELGTGTEAGPVSDGHIVRVTGRAMRHLAGKASPDLVRTLVETELRI